MALVLNKGEHDCKDWLQTSSLCHPCVQEPSYCSGERQGVFPDQRVYRHTDGYSLTRWLLWKRSGTPVVVVSSQVLQPEENPSVFSSWSLLLPWHIPRNNTSAFRCSWRTPCRNKHIFWSLSYLQYLWVQHFFCCTSPQVITGKPSTYLVAFRHDVSFLKIGVGSCQLL